MANTKITDLTEKVTGAAADEFAINDAGTDKKMGMDGLRITADQVTNAEQTATFIVSKSGTDYTAKNGSTGKDDYSGTNGSTVIQSALDDMTTGGLIFFKNATYVLDTTLSVDINTTIRGESKYGFELQPDASFGDNAVLKSKAHARTAYGTNTVGNNEWQFNVYDCFINMENITDPTQGTGIEATGVSYAEFANLRIDSGKIGIYLRGTTAAAGGFSSNCWIHHIFTHNCQTGIWIDSTDTTGTGVGAPEGIIEQCQIAGTGALPNGLTGIKVGLTSGAKIRNIEFQGIETSIETSNFLGGDSDGPNKLIIDGIASEQITNGLIVNGTGTDDSILLYNWNRGGAITNDYIIRNNTSSTLGGDINKIITFISSPGFTYFDHNISYVELDVDLQSPLDVLAESGKLVPIRSRMIYDVQGTEAGEKKLKIESATSSVVYGEVTWSGTNRTNDATAFDYGILADQGSGATANQLKVFFQASSATEDLTIRHLELEVEFVG